MKINKMILTGLTGAAFLAGCGQTGTDAEQSEVNSSAAMSSEMMSSENMESSEEQTTILYRGTVAAQEETSDESILVKDMTPVDYAGASKFDEVLLLMNDTIPLTDQKTGKDVNIADVQEGDTVEVTLVENAPTTMSIPPQIAGNGIVKVEVVSPE